MTTLRSSIPFDEFITRKETNNVSAIFASGLFEESRRFNAALDYNRQVKEEYDAYLEKKYPNAPLREKLRLENLTQEEGAFRRLSAFAKQANYDLNNGMFTIQANKEGTGYDVVKATQSTYNKAVYLMSGQSNRKTLFNFAGTGIARTHDAQSIYNAPEWAKPLIEDVLKKSIGGDILEALEEDKKN